MIVVHNQFPHWIHIVLALRHKVYFYPLFPAVRVLFMLRLGVSSHPLRPALAMSRICRCQNCAGVFRWMIQDVLSAREMLTDADFSVRTEMFVLSGSQKWATKGAKGVSFSGKSFLNSFQVNRQVEGFICFKLIFYGEIFSFFWSFGRTCSAQSFCSQ